MSGLCEIKDLGQLDPAFGANTSFRAELAPPDGVIERIDFYLRGDHTTNITTVQQDGEHNIFTSLQMTINRKGGLRPVFVNVLPRDLKHINNYLAGHRNNSANPTGTTLIHHGRFSIPLVLPPHLTRIPTAWGIDSADIAGTIKIEGQYSGVASIGTGSTAITNITDIAACVRRRTAVPPLMVLSMNSQRINHDAAGRLGPETISTGNLDALWGFYMRMFDSSLIATDRPDGLITRFEIEHSDFKNLSDEFFIMSKRRTAEFFKFPLADIPDGIALPVFAQDGLFNSMPSLRSGQTLKVRHISDETVPVEVTNVAPAAGDAWFAVPIGVQLTTAGEAQLNVSLQRARGRQRIPVAAGGGPPTA